MKVKTKISLIKFGMLALDFVVFITIMILIKWSGIPEEWQYLVIMLLVLFYGSLNYARGRFVESNE